MAERSTHSELSGLRAVGDTFGRRAGRAAEARGRGDL